MTLKNKKSSLTHQVSRALVWNTFLSPLKTIVELIANIILLNVLTLPQIGLLRLVKSAAASLGIWVDLGIDRALPRFIPELEQEQGKAGVKHFMLIVFVVKTVLLLFFTLTFLLCSHSFTTYLSDRVQSLPERFDANARQLLQHDILSLLPYLIGTVLVLVILGSFYDGLMAYLISYFRQRAWNLIGLIGSVLQPALTAILVLAGKGVGGVLGAMVLTPVLSVVLASWQVVIGLIEKDSSLKPALSLSTENPQKVLPQVSTQLWHRFLVYAGASNVLNLSDYFLSWFFAVFLLKNLADVALYSVGTALVQQALALLYTPLVGVQVPLFTRVRGGDGQLPQAYAAVGRILALILIPGGVGLALLAHELILVQYPHYAEATVVIYLLIPCLFLESFLSSAQIVLQVYEQYRALFLSRAITLLVLPILIWAASRYGLVGAALAVGGGRVLMGLTAAFLAQRIFPLRYSWAFLGRVVGATALMTLVVIVAKAVLGLDQIGETLMARLGAAGWLLLIAALGALTFGLALRLFGGIEPEDKQRIQISQIPLLRWLLA